LILNPTLKFSESLSRLTHKPLDYDPASLTALADPEAAGTASDSTENPMIQTDNQYTALKENTAFAE
jgi:hypothetical protein